MILQDNVRRLAAFECYEQRALSQRNAAIRAFDAARRQQLAKTGLPQQK